MAVNNVSLSDSLLAEVREAAESEHRTTDAVLEDAVRKYIDDRSWARLREYGNERGRASEFQGEEGIDRAIAEYRTEKRTR